MGENQNAFHKQLKKLGKLGREIYTLSDQMLCFKNAVECQQSVEKADKAAEKARLLVRDLILESGNPRAIQVTEDILEEVVPVEMGFTEEGWYYLHIPLLPPKKTAGSARYVRSYLYPAMRKFFEGQPNRRIFPECVVCFLHRYDKNFPEKAYRDQDNIETNMVVDTIALYLMEDDGAKRCWHFYAMVPGEVSRTEVYLVPPADYITWFDRYLGPSGKPMNGA